LFLPAILLFIAGGFSESYALAQIVLLFFVLIAVKVNNFPEKTERIKIILSGAIGAVLALCLMYISPGNATRAASVTHPESIKFVIVSTFYGTKWYLFRMLSVKPFIYSLFFLFTAVLLLVKHIELKTRDAFFLCLLPVFAAVLITAAVIGSGFYSMSIIPPERTLFVAIYMILICFTVFSFALASLILKSKIRYLNLLIWIIVLLNLFTSFLLIKSVISNWSGVYTQVNTYAVTWDSEEKNLTTEVKNGRQPSLKNISPVGELDSFTDNKGWVLSCVKDYYQIDNIKLR
jgi:hypothetical protein